MIDTSRMCPSLPPKILESLDFQLILLCSIDPVFYLLDSTFYYSLAGVFAVRAGPPLLENLVAYLTNQPLEPHIPQSTCLGLLMTGNKSAIASRGSWLALQGTWVWKLKDYIDRTWMDKYTVKNLPDLQQMMDQMTLERLSSTASLPGSVARKKGNASVLEGFASDPMRCGGCGAKVGSTTLSRVLQALYQHQVQRAQRLGLPPPIPIDHDDAAIVPISKSAGGGGTAAMIHTIDYFRSLVSDPYIFGKIVAVHALSDVHAMGVKAQSALSLAVVPFAADESITESTLLQLLSGIGDVLQDEQIGLIGGHTCEGMELSCGLAIQGYTDNRKSLLRKGGGRVGDKIILTKPLGTGALFAADMRAKCKGSSMLEAIQSMQQSNGPASQVAASMNEAATASGDTAPIHSCTDCTGFGLIGHLLEMLLANDDDDADGSKSDDNGDNNNNTENAPSPSIGAELTINSMKFYRGGLEASSQGIYSTLQAQNARNRRAVSNHTQAAEMFPVEYPLLFDPQTSGGLLFFVDQDASDELLAKLQEQGVSQAAVIGHVVAHIDNNNKNQNRDSSNGIPASEQHSTLRDVCTIANSGGRTTGRRIQIDL
jgi:selenide, water dikinase